jgi:O-antigen ligase
MILVLAVVAFFAILLPKPETGIALLAFTLPISAIPLLGNTGLFKIAGLAAFAAWIPNLIVGRRRAQLVCRLTVVFAVFLLTSLCSAVMAGTAEAWMALQRLALGIGLYFMVTNLVTSWEQITHLLRWMVASGALVITLCLYLFLSGSALVREFAEASAVTRMQGLELGVDALAQFAVVLLMIALAGPFGRGFAFLGRLTVPLFTAVVVFTASREAFLALALGLLLYLVIGKHRLLGILSAGVLAAIPLLVPTGYFERIATIWEPDQQGWRTQLFPAAMHAFSVRPLIGWGLAAAPHAIYPYHNIPRELSSHNTVLEVMVNEGLFGAIPFLAAALLAVGVWYRVLRDQKHLAGNARSSSEALLLALVAFGVCAMFADLLLDPMVYFLMGLLVAATKFPTPGWNRNAGRNLSPQPDLRGSGQPDDGCQHSPQAAGAC